MINGLFILLFPFIIIIIIIIIFIYLPSDVISQEKKLQLPLGLSIGSITKASKYAISLRYDYTFVCSIFFRTIYAVKQ